jgi:hypothetical protein
MSEIVIKVAPGQQIEIGGRRYETTGELRCPANGEFWLTSCHARIMKNRQTFGEPRIILRPLPVRKIPTDQDAAVWPRRKCWVRDCVGDQWEEAILLSVVDSGYFFSATNDECGRVNWRFCEIEVQE